ncbi:MAG: phosphatidylserine decarboxylase [Phycisphaerae bacterium]|nr:phosphatidylserine decarboxylase [Gemmatimonadaceae bacterium]
MVAPARYVHRYPTKLLAFARSLLREELNFLLTNRIPRQLLTRLAGRLSRVESPLLTRLSIPIWSFFSGDLRLEEAEVQQFPSLHACFTRRLRAGARSIEGAPEIMVSPCDAIVGATGIIEGGMLLQAKGLNYPLEELLCDRPLAKRLNGGRYVTLRLTASMYHRFHAPCGARISRVRYISGDTWNVNPIALKRIEKLFCRNERLVIELELPDARLALALVPVAAILVASIRLHALPATFNLQYNGAEVIECDADVAKGDELGYFENGSTIIVLASHGFDLCSNVVHGARLQMGQSLFRRTAAAGPSSPFTNSLPDHDHRERHDIVRLGH